MKTTFNAETAEAAEKTQALSSVAHRSPIFSADTRTAKIARHQDKKRPVAREDLRAASCGTEAAASLQP
jgi:hypothetical protein